MAGDHTKANNRHLCLHHALIISLYKLTRKWHPDAALVSLWQTNKEEISQTSFTAIHPFIPIKQSVVRGVSGLMADSYLISTLQNSWSETKTLYTCKHEVCTRLTPPICILLLIPSSGKVITLLASQTLPKNTQICFLCGHVLMDMKAGEKRNPFR